LALAVERGRRKEGRKEGRERKSQSTKREKTGNKTCPLSLSFLFHFDFPSFTSTFPLLL
jgi:hypothetical protein